MTAAGSNDALPVTSPRDDVNAMTAAGSNDAPLPAANDDGRGETVLMVDVSSPMTSQRDDVTATTAAANDGGRGDVFCL
jgi:hypothetical protein